MGDVIAAPALTLVDDPTNPESLGADSHDGEGLADQTEHVDRRRRPHDVPAEQLHGPPREDRLDRIGSARLLVTARRRLPRVRSPRREHCRSTSSYAEVGEGVLVQEVTGLHSGANPVSGDFSVGAEGVMIRDGAFAEPVREVTIASTLQRMLLDIVAIGGDLEWLPGGDAGVSLAIGDVALSGS